MNRVLVTLFLLFVGCAKHDPRKEVHFYYADRSTSRFEYSLENQLAALISSNPATDAERAFGAGDRRYVGVLGIDLIVPGISPQDAAIDRARIKTITGTTDALHGSRHAEMNQRAGEYAQVYNAKIISMTTSAKGPTRR